MSVIKVSERSARGGFDRDGNRQWNVDYTVRTDNRSDGPLTILTDILSPAYGSSYEFGGGLEADPGAYRSAASCDYLSEDGSLKVWVMTVTYSSAGVLRPDQTLFGGGEGTNDPTTITRISGSFVPFQEAVSRDRHGDPVVNAAKDLFEGLTKDKNRPTLSIEKTYTAEWFEANLDSINIAVSNSAVNDLIWMYHSADTWKITGAPWSQLFFGQEKYYRITWSIELNTDTWHLKPANVGPAHWVGGLTGTYTRFADDLGLQYSGDGRGALEADGTQRARSSDPVVIYFDGAGTDSAGDPFEVYPPVDFNAKFSLPETL